MSSSKGQPMKDVDGHLLENNDLTYSADSDAAHDVLSASSINNGSLDPASSSSSTSWIPGEEKAPTTNVETPITFDEESLVKQEEKEEEYNENDFTNDPHPALETPFLYFFLRSHPRMLNAIQCLYRTRWGAGDPFKRLIPFTRKLRKVRVIWTWSDVLLIIPFVFCLIKIFIYSFVFPSVRSTGNIARIPLIFTFMTAMRNNLLTLLMGMPVERVIKYHKISAKLSYFNSLMHAYVALVYRQENVPGGAKMVMSTFMVENTVNTSGTLMVVFMTGMIITALPIIRRKLFELFYYVHIFFALAVVLCATFHTGYLVPLMGCLLWGSDLMIRRIYMPWFRYPRKATLQAISDTVVEVSFPKTNGFDFNPGQYVHIAIPKLSYLQWHPFSISSSPKQQIVTLHVRRVGNWTNDLYALAKDHTEVEILMEGPYGSVGVDINHPIKYKTVMLFSGGIGVTPMQSLCNTLLWEHHSQVRTLNKLSFIWIERDPVIMEEVDVVRRQSQASSSSRHLNGGGGSSSMRMDDSSTNASSDPRNIGAINGDTFTRVQHLRDRHSFKTTAGRSTSNIVENNTIRDLSDRHSFTTGSTKIVNSAGGVDCRRHSCTTVDSQIANNLLALLPRNQETDEELAQLYASVNFDSLDSSSNGKEIGEGMAETMPPITPVAGLYQRATPSKNVSNTNALDDGSSNDKRVSFAVDHLDPSWHAGEEEVLDSPFLDETFPSNDVPDEKQSSPLNLQVYVTSKNLSRRTKQRLAQMDFVTFGRPNVSKLFYKAKQDAIDGGERRVAVCLCAPPRLVQLCRDACAKYSDGQVTFDIHCEEFY